MSTFPELPEAYKEKMAITEIQLLAKGIFKAGLDEVKHLSHCIGQEDDASLRDTNSSVPPSKGWE
jgi:hypothetical protein